MQALKRILPTLLSLAAVAVVLATLFSDHDSEYGEVTLPRGGVVTLPEGTVKVFVHEAAPNLLSSDPRKLSAPLSLQVIPVGGGPQLVNDPTTTSGTGEQLIARSSAVGSGGAVASLDVPSAGGYRVSGSLGQTLDTTITFGQSPFAAVAAQWKLLAGLLGAAFLISIVPVKKRSSSHDSSDGSTSTFKPPPHTPYRG